METAVISIVVGAIALGCAIYDIRKCTDGVSWYIAGIFGLFLICVGIEGVFKSPPKTEYKIELINQQQVRINNDTIQFENIEEYIERDNL